MLINLKLINHTNFQMRLLNALSSSPRGLPDERMQVGGLAVSEQPEADGGPDGLDARELTFALW